KRKNIFDMTLLSTLLSKGLKMTKIIEQESLSPFELQKKELKKLLRTARHTHFGLSYSFDEILSQFEIEEEKTFYSYYCKRVPVFNYNKIFKEWWYRSKEGESNVCWPGTIKYFALS